MQKEGESKSAFNARIKKERKEAEKAEKKKSANDQGDKKGKKEEEEEILDPTQYFENRSHTITNLKNTKKPHPYPHKFQVDLSVRQFVEKYKAIAESNTFLPEEVSVAGRIVNLRTSGKLIFYVIAGDGAEVQALCRLDEHKGDLTFEETHKLLRRGDIIGIKGKPGKSNTGELSIAPGEVVLLSPCLHMLPKLAGEGRKEGQQDQDRKGPERVGIEGSQRERSSVWAHQQRD